jgi:dihydrofolate synthase/folylpolyglutamate synthase
MTIWRVPYPKFGDGPGLARVGAVADRLGVSLKAFGETGAAVVGSNGKGSTAAMTAALIDDGRGEVGLFTSPHLFDLNERFRIGDVDISDDELGQHWGRVERAIAQAGVKDKLGGFEFLFLIAADWFSSRGCARTVWEAGIGGRLDPVRLIEAKRLALTSLDFEHTELLGETLEEIARNKLDAAPRGAHVFVSRSCDKQRDAIASHCQAQGLTCTWTEEASAPSRWGGDYQRQNAALADALAHDVLGAPRTESVRNERLSRVRWPGRLEAIGQDPVVVIDVGHTPAAVEAALAGFRAMVDTEHAVLVCGTSRDKAVEPIVARLAPAFDVVICASARHKGAPAALIAQHAAAANARAEVLIAGDVSEAYRLALARARRDGSAVYVAGGLFLASEFKAVHLGRDPASLVFF